MRHYPHRIDREKARRDRQEATDELCRTSFRRFAIESIRYLNLGTDVQWPVVLDRSNPRRAGWYLDAITEHLEALINGDVLRLLINIKNRSLKSTLGMVDAPAWAWLNYPWMRFFTGGHHRDLAVRDCWNARQLINTTWYQRLNRGTGETPREQHFELTGDQNEKSFYANTRGGRRMARQVGGGTGDGGHCFLIDDPLSIDGSYRDLITAQANEWMLNTVMSRLDDPKKARVGVIQHRLRPDDTSGVLVAEDMGFVVLQLPLEYDPRSTMVVSTPKGDLPLPPNPLGWTDPRTELGESLAVERWGPEQIESDKRTFKSLYQALCNQRPEDRGERVLKEEWGWRQRRWTILPDLKDGVIVQTWDPNKEDPLSPGKVEERSLAVGQVWLFIGGTAYLVDRVAGRWEFAELTKMADMMAERWPQTRRWWIENTANGPALISYLKRKYPGVMPVRPTRSKYHRFSGVSHHFMGGNIYLPPSALGEWVEEVVDQLERFPGSPNDDVDCVSQVLEMEWSAPAEDDGETLAQTEARLLAMLRED